MVVHVPDVVPPFLSVSSRFKQYLLLTFHRTAPSSQGLSIHSWSTVKQYLLLTLHLAVPSSQGLSIHSGRRLKLMYLHWNYESKCDLLHLPTWVCKVIPARGAEAIPDFVFLRSVCAPVAAFCSADVHGSTVITAELTSRRSLTGTYINHISFVSCDFLSEFTRHFP